MGYRIGFGKDIHRLIKGRDLILGGIKIESKVGEDAYSDGDVLLHSVVDALLGAISEGDIGELFPDSDPRYKNVPSSIFLKKALDILKTRGYKINNIDCYIELERPKISPYKKQIQKNLATLLNIDENDVSIKAGTCEKMGEVGRGEAISAYSLILIEKIEEKQ